MTCVKMAVALLAAAMMAPTAQAQTPLAQRATTSPSPEAAWSRYRDTLAEYRQKILATAPAADPQLRAQALYYLQSQEAVAFNFYVASRTQYPALYTQSFFMPLEISWGLPNPDFLNHNGFIDGAHTYRIYGNIRGIRWATLQVGRGFWGDAAYDTFHNVDFDDLPKDKDGNFEIFLGPNPPADTGGKYWVKLDPAARNSFLTLREVSYDWQRDTPMDVHIELLDRAAGAPIYPDQADLTARIDKARSYLVFAFEYVLRGLQTFDKRARNQFQALATGNARKEGGNPLGNWVGMLYDIKPDEALIIEMPVIKARYWGVQLGTVWQQTTDYSYHQSSLNMEQARLDADGKFRAVLALSDPGVPNWLDPAGLPTGNALLRFYKSEGLVVPTVTKVPLRDVRRHLPKDTPVVTPAERKAALDLRRRASLRRYGQ